MKLILLRVLPNLPLLLISLLSVKLYLEGTLTFYVHPRYLLFILIFGVIGAVLALLFIVFALRRKIPTQISYDNKFYISLIATVVLLLAIVLPPQQLSAELAEKRTINTDNATGECTEFKPGLYDSDFLQISDLIALCGDPLFFREQDITVEGFVYNATGRVDANTLAIGRFAIRCCAVDAQPISLPVEVKNWTAKYEKQQWLRVEGEFQPRRVNGELRAVIVPEKIEKIPEPQKPYAFYYL